MNDDEDLDWKEVAFPEEEKEEHPALEPGNEGRMVTLEPIPLQDLIALMRQTGFWFNPNLRPDFPDLRGHFTNFLPHLARCRMLVQCNPNQTCDQVHNWMQWREGGSARVNAVQHVPINDHATFLDQKGEAEDGWWRYLRQIIHDTVELKLQQRWLQFYRTTITFDGKNERLLRIVHLGCHALTACAFFLAPIGLVPERIMDHGGTKSE